MVRGARGSRGSPRPALPALAGSLVLLAALACGEPASDAAAGAPEGPRPVAVELLTLRPRPIRDVVALTGQLVAENEVAVRSEIDGIIASIEFEEGQAVAEGDVLFRLRDAEQRARLTEARAQQRLARDVYERTQRLQTRDVSSLARKVEAEARLDEARARTALAELEVERTRIRAPFDGVVGARQVAPGARVEPEDELTRVLAVDRLQAAFTVQEVGVPLVRPGLPVHVRVAAYPGERFPGEVFFVSPGLDPAARRLVLKAWIENPDHRLKPGMFVNVDVEVARKEAALVLPEAAIVYDRHGIFVWRAGPDGGAEKVPVELGIRKQGVVEVVAGLAPGDRIVAAGTHKVLAGSPLRDPREPAQARDARAKRDDESQS